jgi:hypothetical protein
MSSKRASGLVYSTFRLCRYCTRSSSHRGAGAPAYSCCCCAAAPPPPPSSSAAAAAAGAAASSTGGVVVAAAAAPPPLRGGGAGGSATACRAGRGKGGTRACDVGGGAHPPSRPRSTVHTGRRAHSPRALRVWRGTPPCLQVLRRLRGGWTSSAVNVSAAGARRAQRGAAQVSGLLPSAGTLGCQYHSQCNDMRAALLFAEQF